MENLSLDEIIITPNLSIEEDGESGVATAIKNKVKKPRLYKVLLHNDDYTTMEFVIYILQYIFGKNEDEATRIMLKVHKEGSGVCGVYTYEVAESKAHKVTELAKEDGQPLLCTVEPE